jgi:hypothetical protein
MQKSLKRGIDSRLSEFPPCHLAQELTRDFEGGQDSHGPTGQPSPTSNARTKANSGRDCGDRPTSALYRRQAMHPDFAPI